MAKSKEIGMKRQTPSREASFGQAPPTIGVDKGAEISMFGHEVRKGHGVWPPSAASVDQKTGFPKGRKM